MSNIKYSVFRYTPSFITAENIILGILIDIDDDLKFYHTYKYKRISEFDDELDINYVKMLLRNLELELDSNLCNTPNMIYKKIRHFVNEFSFDKTIEIENVSNEQEIIENLKKMYLRYDYDKTKRLSKSQELKMFNLILRSKKIKYTHNAKTVGSYSENITYDYIIGNYGIKFFSFNNKDLSKTLSSVKCWAWNCQNNSNHKTVFLYEYDIDSYPKSKEQVKMLINILKSGTEQVYNIKDSNEFVNFLESTATN